MLRRLIAWAPVTAQLISIYYVSSVADLGPLPADLSDHSWHFIAYFVLGACFLWAFAGARWHAMTARAGAWAVVASSVYGATDEYHQSFVPGRTPDAADWLADTIGAAAAVVLAVLGVVLLRRVLRSGRAV